MHIAIVTSGYYGLSGAFTNARELSTYLSKNGHDVTVLSPDVQPEQNIGQLYFVRIRDLPFVPQNLFYFTTLRRMHQERSIDVILIYDSIAFISVYFFACRNRIPTVFSVQASIFSQGRNANYSFLATQVYKFTNCFVARRADKLICISQEMTRCALYAGASEDNIFLVHNPIDLSCFKPTLRKKINKTCLYVGALSPVKGVEYLIHAIPQILKLLPDTRFLLIGEGPQRELLEELIQKYEVGKEVELLGYMPHNKLLPYYQQADLFVMPSINEPQGIVALEAMACGLPVVASNVGGIPEMVQHGKTGMLVPPAEPESLAKAIVDLFANERMYHSYSTCALNAVNKFSWAQNISRYINIFLAMLRP
jgi:glycosyltransferase involved in cell wall biosynthesis